MGNVNKEVSYVSESALGKNKTRYVERIRAVLQSEGGEIHQKYVNSHERKSLGKDAERLYAWEKWVKHCEVRSLTIQAIISRARGEHIYVDRKAYLRNG